MRTAADTASEDNSCGHRRCWTAAASKGLFCLVVCIVLVLVAVRFGSWTMMAELCFSVDDFIVLFSSNFSNSSCVIASFPLPSPSAIRLKLCLTDRVWVNRPKRTSTHERLYIHETAATPSVTLAVVVTRTSLCNDCRAVRVSLPEPVLGLLFFFRGSTYTYLGSRLIPGTNKRAQTSLRTYVAHNTYPTLAHT